MIEVKENTAIYGFGDFKFNVGEKCLFRGANRINLTPRNFELLLILVENNGKLLEKQTLLSLVWKDTAVEEGNLTRTISSLRKILNDTKEENLYIQTIPRTGYRFIADVELVKQNIEHQAQHVEKKSNSKHNLKLKILLTFGILLIFILCVQAFVNWDSKGNISQKRLNEKKSHPIRLTNTPQDEQIIGWTNDGKLRFVRRLNNNLAESYVMNQDGSNQSKQQVNSSLQFGVWSPNGEKVVFSKVGNMTNDLNYLSDADGSNEVKLPLKAENVSWSNDGQDIVFQSVSTISNDSENVEIFLYNINSKKLSQITRSKGFDGDPAFSPDGQEIVFVSTRDGDFEIYLMNVNGENVRRLTHNSAKDSFPRFSSDGTGISFTSTINEETTDIYFMSKKGVNIIRLTTWKSNELSRASSSPDGTKIAFNSDKDGNDEIYIMDFESAKVKPFLSDENASLQTASFSKDGNKLIYSAELPDKTFELRILDLATNKNKKILNTSSGPNYPRFSPDGKKIAFHQEVNGRWDIFTLNSNGTELKNLTENYASDSIPNWFRDGEKLIFRTNRNGESLPSELFSMDADGSNQKPLPIKQGSLGWSSISDDGKKIIYSCDRKNISGALLDIYVANSDGSNEKLLLTRLENDMQAVFSPDGKKIVFVATSDGNPEIYMMNSDASDLFRLTRNVAKDLNPVFSTDGKKIIFSSDREGKFALYQTEVVN